MCSSLSVGILHILRSGNKIAFHMEGVAQTCSRNASTEMLNMEPDAVLFLGRKEEDRFTFFSSITDGFFSLRLTSFCTIRRVLAFAAFFQGGSAGDTVEGRGRGGKVCFMQNIITTPIDMQSKALSTAAPSHHARACTCTFGCIRFPTLLLR